jgi:phosphoserine phosphatase
LKALEEQHGDTEKRNTIPAQLDFLQSLDEVEMKSQKRIEEGELFVGFDPIAMKERAATQVKLRPGFREMMAKEEIKKLEMHIISVHWSAQFISAALQGSAASRSICANEIEIDPSTGKGTGRLTKSKDAGESEGRYGIRIAQHKVKEMKRILATRNRGDIMTIYAGDSNTDLAALLEANVGLILGNNKGFRETLTRLGFDSQLSKTVDEWKEKRRRSTQPSKPDLIIVEDWFKGAEVLEELLSKSK